ncbi:hypothetical protein MSHO_58420 [Mycobacterium shottsii]|uniref:Uncharacterized protein n=1 Tax=Mycobacterium shottsii TaxID=133549 RepID=A0A7I7LLP0_9MYCO|nr:hypothetical protein MSHO_58420 [Mycobacterium shottsii]
MRVVAAPHDAVDTDSVALCTLDRAQEAGADVALAGQYWLGCSGSEPAVGPAKRAMAELGRR